MGAAPIAALSVLALVSIGPPLWRASIVVRMSADACAFGAISQFEAMRSGIGGDCFRDVHLPPADVHGPRAKAKTPRVKEASK